MITRACHTFRLGSSAIFQWHYAIWRCVAVSNASWFRHVFSKWVSPRVASGRHLRVTNCSYLPEYAAAAIWSALTSVWILKTKRCGPGTARQEHRIDREAWHPGRTGSSARRDRTGSSLPPSSLPLMAIMGGWVRKGGGCQCNGVIVVICNRNGRCRHHHQQHH